MGKYLTERERFFIELSLKEGKKPYKIAHLLGRNPQTIYNEIKRGTIILLNSNLTTRKEYLADVGQRVMQDNSHNKGRSLAIGNNQVLADRLEVLIRDKHYSPYSALEICKKENINVNICEKTLYSYIHKKIFVKLTNKDLRYKIKKKTKTNNNNSVSLNNKKGTSIEKRPKNILSRNSFGHWELDTVCGKQGTKSCLFVFTERKTRYELIFKMPSKSIISCLQVLNNLENKYQHNFNNYFKTITCDNGAEFLQQDLMEQSFIYPNKKRTQIYYCHPYCSSERGSNENANKLIRRFIPKGIDINSFTDNEIYLIQEHINTMPRKLFKGTSSKEFAKIFEFS